MRPLPFPGHLGNILLPGVIGLRNFSGPFSPCSSTWDSQSFARRLHGDVGYTRFSGSCHYWRMVFRIALYNFYIFYQRWTLPFCPLTGSRALHEKTCVCLCGTLQAQGVDREPAVATRKINLWLVDMCTFESTFGLCAREVFDVSEILKNSVNGIVCRVV